MSEGLDREGSVLFRDDVERVDVWAYVKNTYNVLNGHVPITVVVEDGCSDVDGSPKRIWGRLKRRIWD